MATITIRRTLDSETLHLPELRPMLGKTVEIVVREDKPSEPTSIPDRWKALAEAAGRDLIDPDYYEKYKALERQFGSAPP